MASRKHSTLTQLDLLFGPQEEWRPVPGYEGFYEVSNLGRIKGIDRFEKAGKRVRRRHGGILKPDNSFGYKRITLSAAGKDRKFMVHALVLSAFAGPRPEGFQVNHLDGNKTNNALNNLEWVTQSENILHALATGLTPVGEKHHQAKLTDKQVLEIRAMIAQGATRRTCALSFGVAYHTIVDIDTCRRWRHLL